MARPTEEVRILRQALERERVMARIRDRLLALHDLDSFSTSLENEWVAALRELGIPVYRVSLQQPTSGGDYGVHWTLLPREETPREQDEHWLSYPWVREAWEAGRPVVIDRRRLEECRFWDQEVRSIIEVPLPGGGSLGVSSKQDQAFGEPAVSALETFAAILATALRRLRHLEAVQRSERTLNQAQQVAHVGSWAWHVETNRIEGSDELFRIAGLERSAFSGDLEDMIGQGVHPEDRAAVAQAAQSVRGGEPQTAMECRVVRPDGAVRVVRIEVGERILDDAGRPVILTGIVQDVTERRQAELNLRVDLALQRVRNQILLMESEADWQKVVADVVDELSSLVVVRDCSIGLIEPQGKGMRFYRAAKDRTFPPIEASEVHPAIQQALETGKPVYRRSRRDPLFEPNLPQGVNSVIDLPFIGGVLAANSVKEEAFSEADIAVLGRFAQIMSEAHRRLQDITERQRLEQELVRMQRLRAVAELSVGVSHNLNNILTGVLLPAQLLQTMTDDPAIRAVVDDIVVSGERATELVHRLHLSVRGKDDLEPRPVSLSLAVDQVIQVTRPLWKDVPEARGVAVEVVTELAATPPVRGTESGLHDLLTNLLLNAVEALPRGGRITVRAWTENGSVRLEFSDNGIGMDEQTRLRVFEPFFTTKPTVGTGLGLSTLYNTVTQWGGKVEVESVSGEGTTFRLWLPVWEGEVRDQTERRPSGPPGPARVLVIDDDQVVGSALAASLRPKHQVDTFTDPEEALVRFAPRQYDLAVIDLGMPGISGEQVARRLAEVDPAVVRVLFSGWELDESDPRRAPFDLFLRKPVADLVTLEALVAQAVQLHEERASRGPV